MRSWLIFFGLVCLSPAPALGETIDLPDPLSVGSRFELTIEKTKERFGPAQPLPAGKGRTMVDVAVLGRDSSGNPLLRWTMGATTIELDQPADPAAAASMRMAGRMASLVQGSAIEFVRDSDTGALRIADFSGTKARMLTIIDAAVAEMRAEFQRLGATEAQMQPLAAMRRFYTDMPEAMMTGTLLKEAQFWLLVVEASVSSEPQAYDDQISLGAGGAPLKTRGEFRLQRPADAGGEAEIRWRQVFDPASAGAGIGALLRGLAQSAGLPPSQAGQSPAQIEIVDDGLFLVDARRGDVKRASVERRIALNGIGMVERTVILSRRLN